MIVLDTNVLSEALRPVPAGMVIDWLAAQQPSSVFITAITQAELLYGVEALHPSKRRTRLVAALEKMLAEEFEEKILPFDEHAARVYAGIVASRAAAGRPISQFDAMIAAIARFHGAAVATRNTSDFDRCGIKVIDPWAK